MKPISIPSSVMRQVGVDLCNLPVIDGHCHDVVLTDYFSKCSEGKPIKDKSASTVAQFLCEVICRHGCFEIQINDQRREFVNEVNMEFHKLTGAEQRITSAYQQYSNMLAERHNRTIKNFLVKVMENNPSKWSYIVERILFAHRVQSRASIIH